MGALIPFTLLYTYGLDRMLYWTRSERTLWLVLAVILLVVTVSECVINADAFSSQYNWFHS